MPRTRSFSSDVAGDLSFLYLVSVFSLLCPMLTLQVHYVTSWSLVALKTCVFKYYLSDL